MHQGGDLIGAPVEAAGGREHHLAPAWFQERGRHALRQGGAPLGVEATEDLHCAEQGIVRSAGPEGEAGQEGRREPAHGGVALHHLLEAVLARAGQIFRFADALFQHLPPHLLADYGEGVATARAGLDQRPPEPGMDAGGLFQELGVVHQPFGAGALRSAEQRTHHLFHHGDGGIGQDHVHLQCEGAERRQPPAALQTGEVLGAHDRRLACDHAVAGKVDAPPAIRLHAEAADLLQPFQHRLQVGRAWGLRPLAQPGQTGAAWCGRKGEEIFQTSDLIGS